MISIVKEETIGEHKHIHYSNGAVVKRSVYAVESKEPTSQPLSETEQAILQTAINTEYMMSLMEVKG